MARAEKATYAMLGAAAGVTALVGTRIYPGRLPQGATLPAIVYTLVDVPGELTHSGADTGLEARVQLTVHAGTYASGKAVQSAIRTALQGYKGTPGSVHVDCVRVSDGPDGFDPETETEQAVTDLLLSYQEA